ncbi:hypothetical protein MBSD_n1585 [Mizugakiibacter sediminis]|uniref:Uncharacterized protein n=1 Tax=Mizugakiibacter sediminis TaxID=1475481 RepID=A0A0K8QNK2_9GAMM|nr:hypothetical protein [Mizugakiibacter sediminis]GAP66281.1 hypothetical protein MBSD_n1585 [Mizugakiibacter sediminis]
MSRGSVATASLERLAQGWDREAYALDQQAARDAIAPIERRLAGMQARTRRACADELRRLLMQEGLRG